MIAPRAEKVFRDLIAVLEADRLKVTDLLEDCQKAAGESK
jgi:hypothetical protein